MGSNLSTNKSIKSDPGGAPKDKSSKVLIFLHRTWTVIVTTKSRTLTRLKKHHQDPNNKDALSDFTSQYSQYSFCSCSQCQKDDGFSSASFSDLFDSASNMGVNPADSSGKNGTFLEEIINKEKQRPPIYNPEDYVLMLKKWGKKSANGGIMSLYSTSSTSDLDTRSQNNSFRDYRNPMLISSGSEMTLRQFGTISELLNKLKTDLKLAFPSFVQEFVADPLDGVTLLLDLLRAIQLSQSNTVIHGPAGSSGTSGKLPPSLQRRALLDELSCLQCLLNCCIRYTESLRKLISSSAGLFTVAVCIMSNVNKSRIIALQLLAKACDPGITGHTAVSEAMSTLRLRFGEPVRFRFLVGMMMSSGGQKELFTCGLKFLNKFLDTAGSSQKRLYIQAEVEQAGMDMDIIKKNIANITGLEHLHEEIQHWERRHINIENLTFLLDNFKKENTTLREKLSTLERKIKALQNEKGVLSCAEKSLKVRCNELQSEIRSLKSTRSSSKGSYSKNPHDSTPNEDEGISSSERSLTPENDELQRTSSLSYDPYKSNNIIKNLTHLHQREDDDETTIDEVIEELRNIINDAECEDLAKINQKKIEEAQVASKLKIHIDADDYALSNNNENEIIPTELHPQPPRRTKSLMHLFVPSNNEDYYYCSKELFFENETPYTSTEGSDSLLSASKCTENLSRCKKIEIKANKNSKLSSTKSESYMHLDKELSGTYFYTTTVNVCQNNNTPEIKMNIDDRVSKSKSLDRIDDGLDSIVDIVVTNQNFDSMMIPKSDSNTRNNSFIKGVSNVYIKGNIRHRFGSCSEENKSIMFLPSTKESLNISDNSYYFPRIEKKTVSNTGFQIKRGHGNAGMYSGKLQNDDRSSVLSKSKEFLAISCGNVGGKVTDLPSGLY